MSNLLNSSSVFSTAFLSGSVNFNRDVFLKAPVRSPAVPRCLEKVVLRHLGEITSGQCDLFEGSLQAEQAVSTAPMQGAGFEPADSFENGS
jgi:hypothetical protein